MHINNQELDNKIKNLAKQERELLREVLEAIQEADVRRLYLDYAYPSLFSYLVEGCGYSEGAAQRRIDAARLMSQVPSLSEKIETGEINLSQIGHVQKAIREKDKIQKVLNVEKLNIISKIIGKTSHESQKIIAQELDLESKRPPKEIFQKDESVRIEVTLSKDQWEKLQKARNLASNATYSNDWSDVLEYLAEKFIRQKEGKQKSGSQFDRTVADGTYLKAVAPRTTISTAAAAVPGRSIRIKSSPRKFILQRDKCCQYRDKKTGKVCGSQWNLHVDHIQPRWAKGGNETSNLRVLCQRHNHHVYQKQAGLKYLGYSFNLRN